ncbi:minor tail protein [Gordonia phage SteamedHams]|nr:minor tail protein [Gordonia phage SteamedHams]QGJ95975.1 minor tail protein [Gordonia phage Yarn]
MKRGDFPVQSECDPKNPKEFAAWALVALPHMNGAALPMSSEYIQLVSEHLWNAGFRWHRKHQKIKWRPPAAGDKHWLTNPGRWVPMNEPDPEPKDQSVDMLTVLRAMKQADEGDFFKAIEMLNTKGKKE